MAGVPTGSLPSALGSRADGIARRVHAEISANIPTSEWVPRAVASRMIGSVGLGVLLHAACTVMVVRAS